MDEVTTPMKVLKHWPNHGQGKGGGPKKAEMTEKEVQLMAMFMCPVIEIAAFYDFTERQLYRRFAQQPELRAAFDRGRAAGKRAIRLKQFKVAVEDGDVSMLRWLGQNLLGQSNKHTMMAEDLNPASMDDAVDGEFTELFAEIEEELKTDGTLIEHQSPETGTGVPVKVEGPGDSDPEIVDSEEEIS